MNTANVLTALLATCELLREVGVHTVDRITADSDEVLIEIGSTADDLALLRKLGSWWVCDEKVFGPPPEFVERSVTITTTVGGCSVRLTSTHPLIMAQVFEGDRFSGLVLAGAA